MIKKVIYICTVLFFTFLVNGCSSYDLLVMREDNFVKKLHKKSDTIHSFSTTEFALFWYIKDENLYSFIVRPYRTINHKPINLTDKTIFKTENIHKYFDHSFSKDIPCFEKVFGGHYIRIHIKGENMINTGLDTSCFFNTVYERYSFPYYWQYVFYKTLGPLGYIDYSFEEMYPPLPAN